MASSADEAVGTLLEILQDVEDSIKIALIEAIEAPELKEILVQKAHAGEFEEQAYRLVNKMVLVARCAIENA